MVKLLLALVVPLLIAFGAVGPGRDVTDFAYWWLTNDQPPNVRLAGPPAAIRGAVDVAVETSPSGRVDLVEANLDGQSLPLDTATLRVDTAGLPDGDHTLVVRVQDRSLRRNAATATSRFRSDNTPPTFELKPTPESVAQGHTMVVHIQPSEQAEVQATLDGAPLKVNATGNQHWAVVGINPDENARTMELVVEGRDQVGNTGRAQGRVEVKPFEFSSDSLQVAPEMLSLIQPAVRAAEDEHLKSVYQRENGPPRWKGAFIQPVKGPISTEFGEVRSYNGGPFQGFHGGTDFQVGMDTPVLAPARGRVALKEEVKLRGKVLILDHGGGVYTTYAHLADWQVEVNQEVEQGQPIATVGSTGLSTGPHLHWELWVNGKTVDPLEWTEREIP